MPNKFNFWFFVLSCYHQTISYCDFLRNCSISSLYGHVISEFAFFTILPARNYSSQIVVFMVVIHIFKVDVPAYLMDRICIN